MDMQKTCCPNCSQLFSLKLIQSSSQRSNLPLFLSCGHSMCENCIKNIIKFLEPVSCRVCHHDTIVNVEDVEKLNQNKLNLYSLFPINVHMVGELTVEALQNPAKNAPKQDDHYYINLHSILKDPNSQGQCMECHKPTSKMCKQCDTILCDSCFNKSHKNFVIFKNHVLQLLESNSIGNMCPNHANKQLEYYCNDCSKAICMDCYLLGGDKSCKNHNIVPMEEVNTKFLEEINDITPKVDETFKRLSKTAVDVGTILYNIENDASTESQLTRILSEVEQHFSKLLSVTQKHKNEVIATINRLKSAEKESLYNARSEIYNYLKKAKQIADSLKLTANTNESKQINLSLVLEDAKQFVETPWYLSKEDSKKGELKVSVNDDLCGLISDYVHLEGNVNCLYKLRSTAQLGDIELPPAPKALVFPPNLPKDVRQSKKPIEDDQKGMTLHLSAPQYRSKSASVSSLNSGGSDHSVRSYLKTESHPRPVVQPVQPFAESQHPKQLIECSQELIYISHIVDPHNFYVQRACHQKLVKEILREFRNAVSLPKPSINHVTEGKIYLAYNKADNMWQRCRIISIDKKNENNPLYQVFCFDFGSTEQVKIDQLRLIPPARLHSPQPLAINCSLANCEPINGVWTNEDSLLIQKIIDNKQAVIYVCRVEYTSNVTIKLECELTTFEDGVNIAQALVFNERAKMPNPKIKYYTSSVAKERPKIFISNDDFKIKTSEQVYITHIVSPDKFYLRKKDCQKIYEKLSEELDSEYSLSVQTGTIYVPQLEMACVVNVEKCGLEESEAAGCAGAGAWARALVRRIEGRARVSLFLVDTGRTAVAHYSTLRHIQQHHTTLKALATECHLAGISPLKKTWSPSSVALLKKYENSLLEARVEEKRNRNSVGVTLLDCSDDDNTVCINKEMIKYKFAVTFGLFALANVEDQVITNKNPLEKPKQIKKPEKPQIKILKRDTKKEDLEPEKSVDLEAKNKGPLRLEAKLINYQSPSLIYVSLVHQQKGFNELFEKIQKYYSKTKTEGRTDWKEGDKCCTLCLASQTWRRANIIELKNDNAKVFYSDFACVETVPVTSLRDLTPEFLDYGNAAIKCHLSGVMPAMGDEWPSLTKEYLKELLDAYPRIFITKIGSFKDTSMPIEIWVYHVIQGGALEPNKSEWRCLNRKIVEQGLGIPDKTMKVEEEVKENTDNEEETISFLNVTGSVREWLQLEPLPMKPIQVNTVTQQDNELSSHSSSPSQTNESSNIMFISDWLPAEPLSSNEFTAMPTYIDNNGIIYLHDITQQETLELIRKSLDARFKSDDPKAKYTKWTVGEPCVAQFYLDQRFYRGRILEVNEEDSTCVVHYIDYGNDEICPFETLRKSIALHTIPIQASKCMLDRIRPIHNKWDRQTLDYIHKTIVERNCYVKVSGEAINGIIPIELKYNKLWINNHLVDFEMAQFTDGSKPVIAKFAPSTSKQSDEYHIVTETDSGPDYIIEDEEGGGDSPSVEDSFELQSLKNKDWNKMIEEDYSSDDDDDYEEAIDKRLSYPEKEVKEFYCNITFINNIQKFELIIVHDNEVDAAYKQMYDEIQAQIEKRPPLNGIYENKSCVALFPEDMQWYRASILQYTKSTGELKVKYIDYGNTEIISLGEAREIDEEWVKLPPACVSVILHGVKPNPNVDIKIMSQELAETFLDKGPFKAIVIEKHDKLLEVELTDVFGGLVYEKLLEKEIFLKTA